MDLPTYTNIWRIEKRLYKLYDFRLPAPLPITWIAVFAGITVPYIIFLVVVGVPFNHDVVWLYVLPPGMLTWLSTRPVIESKRLPELVSSQLRYLAEPRTWCRMAPFAEKDHVLLYVRVWRRSAQQRRPAPRRAAAPPAASRAAAPRPQPGRPTQRRRGSVRPARPQTPLRGPMPAARALEVSHDGVPRPSFLKAGVFPDGADVWREPGESHPPPRAPYTVPVREDRPFGPVRAAGGPQGFPDGANVWREQSERSH